jgi:hypothetical protein
MATTPAATPVPAKRSGWGCLIALVLLPIVVIAGLVVGTVLRDDDEPTAAVAVTLDEGVIDGVGWRVAAELDVEGDSCVFLYEDGEQLNGACDDTPQDATFGEQTVVFGRAGGDVRTVDVVLSDGEVIEVDTVTAEGVDGRFYVEVVEGDVNAERLNG